MTGMEFLLKKTYFIKQFEAKFQVPSADHFEAK